MTSHAVRHAAPSVVFQTVTTIRAGLLLQARTLILATRPDLAARRTRAVGRLEDPDPAVSRAAADELAVVFGEAMDQAQGAS